jgi:putative tryptophan/tyrosine transport system substrate-binding protein
MGNVDNPVNVLEMREIREACAALGLEVDALEIRRTADIVPAFEALKRGAQALYVAPDPLVITNQIRINTLALGARLPTMHGLREYVEAGGLMSYGANFPDMFRRAAEYADKILRGAKPADLPVEQPTKLDLVINLITAKGLGLEVPPTLLARADEVIECSASSGAAAASLSDTHTIRVRRLSSITRVPWRKVIGVPGQRRHAARYVAIAT